MENSGQFEKGPYISVIIPIYKVEQYLERCVKSVLTQTYENMEIILVDDGSPDSCPGLCDSYQKLDLRVKVIHKTNGGLSSARNSGLIKANGDFVIFLDSDDFWNDNTAIEKIAYRLKCSMETDVLLFRNLDYSCISGKQRVAQKEYDCEYIRNHNGREALIWLFDHQLFPGAAWQTVTRREFLLKNSIFFIENIKAEDIDWLLSVMLKAKKIDAVNDAFYTYLKYRGDSITGTADIKSLDSILMTLDKWEDKMKRIQDQKVKMAIGAYLSGHYLCTLLIYNNLDTANRKEYKERLRSRLRTHAFLLDFDSSIKGRCAKNVIKLLGIDAASALLYNARQIKKQI